MPVYGQLSSLLQSSVHEFLLFLSVSINLVIFIHFEYILGCWKAFHPWIHNCKVRSPWNTQHWHLAVEWRLSTGNYFSICYPCVPLALQCVLLKWHKINSICKIMLAWHSMKQLSMQCFSNVLQCYQCCMWIKDFPSFFYLNISPTLLWKSLTVLVLHMGNAIGWAYGDYSSLLIHTL